jgi:hypothetical protein
VALHSVNYAVFDIPASPSFPNGRKVLRPYLNMALVAGPYRLSCKAMVDSGADDCLFPRSFLQPLGIDPLALPVDFTGGVGNNRNATQYAKIVVDIQGIAQFDVYAGFTVGMDPHGFGLLGQCGFFDRVKIVFDYANRIYAFETPPR